MSDNIVNIDVKLPNYLVERLKTLAINKSKKICRNVTWQDIFNKIYDNAIKDYVKDMVEEQLVENLDLVEEKSKDSVWKEFCDVYYIERGIMEFNFKFEVDEAKFLEYLESRGRKLKNIYNSDTVSESFRMAWDSSDFASTKVELKNLAYNLFIETISESVNEELMRDKNCWG